MKKILIGAGTMLCVILYGGKMYVKGKVDGIKECTELLKLTINVEDAVNKKTEEEA